MAVLQDVGYLNQFYGETNASTTTTENAFAFGFRASKIRVQNDKATAVQVNFATSSPSTGGIRTCSGELLELDGPASFCSVASQTTTTGTIVRVWATGG